MSLADALGLVFADEARRTRAVLEVVPKDRFDWRPHEKSMTLGELAGHLAEMPAWVRLYLAEGLDLDHPPDDLGSFAPESREDLLGRFDENVALFLSTLATMDDEFLEAGWTMRSGERVLHQAPRRESMQRILIHHQIHHRGQLTVYLRLLDVPLPPTYGPSADSPV
jgi:uncharacterized damage-inducible protein DinB